MQRADGEPDAVTYGRRDDAMALATSLAERSLSYVQSGLQHILRGADVDPRTGQPATVEDDLQLRAFRTAIGEEIERRKKGGESEMKATMEVMKKYRSELQALQR